MPRLCHDYFRLHAKSTGWTARLHVRQTWNSYFWFLFSQNTLLQDHIMKTGRQNRAKQGTYTRTVATSRTSTLLLSWMYLAKNLSNHFEFCQKNDQMNYQSIVQCSYSPAKLVAQVDTVCQRFPSEFIQKPLGNIFNFNEFEVGL